MIYRVVVDNQNIYDETPTMALISPSVSTELNASGSFDFTMPSGHDYYSKPKLLTSDVEVYEGNELIFYGRPIEINTDFFNQKKIHCEGALAFFNDSILRPQVWENTSIRSIFSALIGLHNAQVPSNRQFTVGTVNVSDKLVYREVNYDTTKDALQKLCLDTTGGYFFTRRVNGTNYIDWLREMPYIGNQPIQYALNITELEQKLNGGEIKTSVIPIGADGINIQDVNSGYDFIDSAAAQTYGRILEKVDFSDISDKSALKVAGQNWLSDNQFEGLSMEINAAELSYLDGYDYGAFKVGQIVHCTSNPHLIDRDFPIVKLDVNLDSGVKQITVGTKKKEKLTEIYKPVDSSSFDGSSSSSSSSSGSGSGSSSGTTYDDTAIKARITALEATVSMLSNDVRFVVDPNDNGINIVNGD